MGDIALFTSVGLDYLFRWGHFMAGITWIGVLYYFNFIQGEYFKEAEDAHRSGAIQKLVPRALWWFRWGAMFTFLTGVVLLGYRHAGLTYDITVGATLGTLMFLNVWLVIWPAQKIVIASATQVAQGGEALPEAAGAAAGRLRRGRGRRGGRGAARGEPGRGDGRVPPLFDRARAWGPAAAF